MPANNYSEATDVGLLRENNEDTVLSDPELGLWLVADGMGGHAAGEVASEVTGRTIAQAIRQGNALDQAIKMAHKAVVAAARDGVGKAGMGSTVVALRSQGQDYEVAWVGDSRAYLWTEREGQRFLQPLTTDHSYVQMLYQSGVISEAEMANHPEKNIITQCLGSTELDEVHVDVIQGKWHHKDWLILCSDGLTDSVDDQGICEVLNSHSDLDAAVQALIQSALGHGGKDNVSIIAIAPPSSVMTTIKARMSRLTSGWKRSGSNPDS